MMFPKPSKKTKTKKALLPRSKNPRKRAHERAWNAFSLYVRLRDADINGYVKCFTCDTPYHYKEMDAGHFIHRASLDFDEFNINPQCTKCNRYLSGNAIEYTLRMIRLYGQEVVDDLMARKNDPVKYKLSDLLELEKYYKTKTLELNNQLYGLDK